MADNYPESGPAHEHEDRDAVTAAAAAAAPPPTVAPFAPNQQTASTTRRNSSVLIHQTSPLLTATPPRVTRALAYSHPFILPLNHVAGLLSWTTGDPWQSFLLVATFWLVALYGDDVTRYAGPLVVIVALVLGMHARRYNPLSRSVWSGDKAGRAGTDSEQRKSLDEMITTLQTFTGRCDVLLDPFVRLIEFMSTQASATSATTRPALTTLFLRILAFAPFWTLLALPPLSVITARRVVLTVGTLGLTWHSRPARVTRAIIWRSRSVRRLCSLLTGLSFAPTGPGAASSSAAKSTQATPVTPPNGPPSRAGVRFTFAVYENQRRWIGLGWTSSLLAYDRSSWTDEQLHPAADPEHFELPDTDHVSTRWRWVPGSAWRVDGGTVNKENGSYEGGWTFYDNKWHDAAKTDSWTRWTRRRKWVRDAELVDIAPPEEPPDVADVASVTSSHHHKRKTWFGSSKRARSAAADKSDSSSGRSRDHHPEDDVHSLLKYRRADLDRSISEGITERLS